MHPKMKEALDNVLKMYENMTDEEFHAHIAAEMKDNPLPKCDPKTCHGDCQGTGDCYLARSFRNEMFGDYPCSYLYCPQCLYDCEFRLTED